MTQRRLAVGVLVLAVVPALAALSSRSFFSPDETNYAQVAREMIETGDVVVPHLDGHPWFNKPPLAYWLLAGSFELLGWGLPAAVLLNSLLTGLTALVVAGHVRRRGTPRAGALAAAAYLTMALPMMVARTALTDPALVLCTTGAIVLFLAPGRLSTLGSGVLLGLGVLAKGPVALLVVVPAVLVAAWQGEHRRQLRRLATTAVVAGVVVLPWQLALVARGSWAAWAHEFLSHEVVARAIETWRIRAPWWYYGPTIWAALFPWGTYAAILLGASARSTGVTEWRRRADLPELAAVAVPLLAFSIATNKLPHYVLPVLPFVAAWLGRAADRLWEQDHAAAPRWATALIAVTGGGALGALAWIATLPRAARVLPSSVAPTLAAAAFVLVALAVLEGAGRRRIAWIGMAALALALRLGVDAGLAPCLDRQSLERPVAEAVRAALPHGGLPIAHRWWRTSLVAYGVRGWQRTETTEQLDAALRVAAAPRRGVVVVARADAEGEVRAAAWRSGGEARERSRIVGLGEIDGEVIEAIVFSVEPRSGEEWFYDADRPLPGESGISGVEGNAWVASFRWTTSRVAALPLDASPHGEATLRLRAWGEPDGAQQQRVDIAIDGHLLTSVALSRFPRTCTVPLGHGLRDGSKTLTLTAAHLVTPKDTQAGSADARSLGIAVDWVSVDPASAVTQLVR